MSSELCAERLEQSEARFRTLTEHLPVGVLVHRGGRLLYANPALRSLVGIALDEDVVGLELASLVHPDDREGVRRRVESLQTEVTATPTMEGRMVRRDGSSIPVDVAAIRVELDGAPAILAMVRDLRERQRMEAQLVLADRLASLGRLAASIGHEINNPLAYVLGNVQLLEREVAVLPGISSDARAVLESRLSVLAEGAARVRDIVRDLRTLSSSEGPTVGSVDLHRVLDVCANMAEHQLRNRARLLRDYGEGTRVRANEARLGQVFLNLLVNAAESILEGHLGDNEVRVSTRRVDGTSVVVEVSDTGTGIPASLSERIFEPFFTTKHGSGTGLGLSICHSIVTSLQGTIEALPGTPRGTCFRVTLPCEPGSG